THLNEIETVRLEDQSTSEPISVEQATEEIVEQIKEPNESRPTIELTLEEVRAAAIANNLDLKVELVDPSIAQQDVDEARAKFESVFFGSARHHRTEAVGSATVSKTSSYEVGIESPLHTGGQITVSSPFSDTEYDGADFEGVSAAAVSVSFIQKLLQNAGTRVKTHPIRLVSHQKHIIDAGTKLGAIYILADADIAYWRLFAAHRELEVRREQYKLAQDQLDHARRKVATGSAPKIEIVRAEAGLASRLEDVITAETTLRNRERDLKQIMNRDDMPMNSAISIVTATEPNPLGLELDEEVMAEAAIANRMEMIKLELRLAKDDIYIELARNDTLPVLTFDYTYTARTQSGTIGGAIGQLANSSSPDHFIGLSATIPLGNEAAKARLRRARLEQIRSLATREQLQLTIRQQVYEAVNRLRQNWRGILAATQGVTAAYRYYKVEQSQFQLGRRTSTDVLYAATVLADAQLRKIRAFIEYEIAQVNLARATGTLLGYGKIQLEPIDIEGK
ncbi:MAG: TolC family protein, partial [Phycisphaerae bacterium]